MAEIALRSVTRAFGSTVAVRDATFTVEDGELFVLVGPSGCGKSTLLNLIAGLDEPDEGRIDLDGRRIDGVDPKDRGMAMVFQSYAVYPHMTVRRNLAFPLELAKLPDDEIRRRIEAAAETLELTPLLDRRPAQLSGGQRQRVAMGRAIVREPEAFLLDEPLSNLDARLRVQTRTEIARLQRRLGTTMIYVTHDQTEAMTLGDRIAVLRDGEVQQVGTPRELYERPANLFVAGFIGSPSMNLLPGEIRGRGLELPMASLEIASIPGEPTDDGKLPDGPVVVGIRPEDLELLSPDEEDREDSFPVRVEMIEWLGAESHVHAEIELEGAWKERLGDLSARAPRARAREEAIDLVVRTGEVDGIEEGDTLRLTLDPSRIHLYDLGGLRLGVDSGTTSGESGSRVRTDRDESRQRSGER